MRTANTSACGEFKVCLNLRDDDKARAYQLRQYTRDNLHKYRFAVINDSDNSESYGEWFDNYQEWLIHLGDFLNNE